MPTPPPWRRSQARLRLAGACRSLASAIFRKASASSLVSSIARTARALSATRGQSFASTASSAWSRSASLRRWMRSLGMAAVMIQRQQGSPAGTRLALWGAKISSAALRGPRATIGALRAARGAGVHPLGQRAGVHDEGGTALAAAGRGADALHRARQPLRERLRGVLQRQTTSCARLLTECLSSARQEAAAHLRGGRARRAVVLRAAEGPGVQEPPRQRARRSPERERGLAGGHRS